jgi:3-oxosteroid 1-dehydrogenase
MPAHSWDKNADVVVIGSGGAGLAAALAAGAGGAKVVILEKSRLLGGTTAMSAAGTWVPANHHMLAAGIDDSPAETLRHLRATAPEGWQTDEDELWQALAEHAPEMLKFVEANSPLEFELVHHPDLYAEAPGGREMGRMVSPKLISKNILGKWGLRIRKSVKPQFFTYKEVVGSVLSSPVKSAARMFPRLALRFLTRQVGMGNALVVGLLKGCLDKGCEILPETAAQRLITDPDTGRVIGLEAKSDGRDLRIRARKGVVLATGGFEWNRELLDRYFPGTGLLGSPRTNTGDGQIMAQQAGALLERMDQANISPSTYTMYEGQRQAQPLYENYPAHSILVNREGRRFVNEGSPSVGVVLNERDPATGQPAHLPVWRIFDAHFARKNTLSMYFGGKDPSWFRKADTIAALARMIDLDPDALAATVARFNQFAGRGVDEDFHRGETVWERFYGGGPSGTSRNGSLGMIDEPPFYAAPFHLAILGTKGGARTNRHGQVLRPDRSIIGGLYAAGLAMANPIGTKAVGAGTTIGPCLTFGYICGRTLLAENQ